jgi:type III restriction enzyme
MLKEGWDVTNLYTIVPLRAANSKTLVEQSVGRGLRLPYGRRTGVVAVDRLNIVSHDRFDEIVNAANDPNSIIRAQVVIGRDIPEKAQKTVEVQSKLQAALGSSAARDGAGAQQLFATEEERTVARDVLHVIESLPRALRTADLRKPEVQQEIVEQVRLQVGTAQAVLAGATAEPVDVAAVVKKTTDLMTTLTVYIPRVIVVPKGNVTARYLDFDLDTSKFPRYAAVAKDIVIQHLTDHERYRLVSGDGVVPEKRLEDYLVFGLMRYDEISYDETAELLYKLAGQAVAHLQAYLDTPEDVENVLQYHRKALVQLIHAQMEEHFEQTATEYEATVSPGFATIKPQLVTVGADGAARDFRAGVDEKSEITGMLFQGFRKCLQTYCKYRSDPERVFSVVLEDDDDVVKWFRPTRRDIKIFYTSGSVDREYEPDFIVETKTGKWICETKKASEMGDPEVQAKAQAAALWCRHASEATGESWGYLLIPHDHVRMSMTFAGFVAGCGIGRPLTS